MKTKRRASKDKLPVDLQWFQVAVCGCDPLPNELIEFVDELTRTMELTNGGELNTALNKAGRLTITLRGETRLDISPATRGDALAAINKVWGEIAEQLGDEQ